MAAREEITINALAERIIALTGSRSTIQHIPYDEAYAPGFEDMRRRVPCIEKIQPPDRIHAADTAWKTACSAVIEFETEPAWATNSALRALHSAGSYPRRFDQPRLTAGHSLSITL